MKGAAEQLVEFLDGAKNRFIIPVYQRNYDWSKVQCKQLFEDLLLVIKEDRKSHFFGSIVSSHAKNGEKNDFLIIDGQQRITTISLVFFAMVNLLEKGIIQSEDPTLAQQIKETFLVDKYRKSERKLRLKPIKDDCVAFDKLITNNRSEFVNDSNITDNYFYFYDELQKMDISVDQFYEAVNRLEIINIFVEDDENPQIIFESLNSTGLGLTEADKIRNFILMGLESDIQEVYYEEYWNKIEKYTDYQVSEFIRHYLTLIQKKIPNKDRVYTTFKDYVKSLDVNDKNKEYKNILVDMLYFAEIYQTIAKGLFTDKIISKCLKRLNHLDVTVSYPFLLALFAHLEKGEIEQVDVEKSLICVESFVFRRLMCPGYTTNSLNKIFCSLDSDILKHKTEYNSYSEICVYVLEHKTGNAAFPNDTEFKTALGERDIYHSQKRPKEYLFDRLENGDTVERVNVIEMMEAQTLSIEHIMPQTPTESWKKSLGPNWKELYETRLHTLPNLTLTGYNSKYSNKDFSEKKIVEDGFKDSGLNLNKMLLDFDKWTAEEMDKRQEYLTKQSLKLWPYPKTAFIPAAAIIDEVTLEDAYDLTGRSISGYKYGNDEQKSTKQWVDMFTEVVVRLYSDDYVPIRKLASDDSFVHIVISDVNKGSDWFKVADDIYLYKSNSTAEKIRILNKLFEVYGKEKDDLILYLKPND